MKTGVQIQKIFNYINSLSLTGLKLWWYIKLKSWFLKVFGFPEKLVLFFITNLSFLKKIILKYGVLASAPVYIKKLVFVEWPLIFVLDGIWYLNVNPRFSLYLLSLPMCSVYLSYNISSPDFVIKSTSLMVSCKFHWF